MQITNHTTYLLDVNILIALSNRRHVWHQRAHQWFANVGSWATTPLTEAAYVRLMLNPQAMGMPVTPAAALASLSSLRQQPGHVFIEDATSLAQPKIDLAGLVGHKQVTDLHLVNLAAAHGAVLATLDAGIEKMLLPSDHHWVCVI